MNSDIHPLDAWLESNGKTREWLAEVAATTEPTISRVVTGKQWPSRSLAQRLTRITKGAVTPNDFLQEREREAS